MTQYKELYGGFYIRNNGRWYWKANSESEEVGPISGFWLRQKIDDAKNKPVKTIEFAKIEEPKQLVVLMKYRYLINQQSYWRVWQYKQNQSTQ